MRIVYGRSPWIDGVARSRVPAYPKHRGNLDVDVAVVGGGLTGCAVAYGCAAAGEKVALFEADRIGRGSTGAAAGWITTEPDGSYLELERAHGRRVARHAWESWRRAALDLEALSRRLGIKAGLETLDALVMARSADAGGALAREQKARSAAGFDGASVAAARIEPLTGFPAVSALRTRGAASIDPYRLTLGLAAAAASRGALLFERSPVARTAFARIGALVTVGTSRISASRVIVTTGAIGTLFKPLARHAVPRITYQVLTEPVPASVRRGLGSRDALLREWAGQGHRINWVGGDRLLVGGADGVPVPPGTRDRVLVQRTGQLMYELATIYPDVAGLRPMYGWDAAYAETPCGLPLAGPHRSYPHHLFALGDGSRSLTAAYLASRILLRYHGGKTEAADEVFSLIH